MFESIIINIVTKYIPPEHLALALCILGVLYTVDKYLVNTTRFKSNSALQVVGNILGKLVTKVTELHEAVTKKNEVAALRNTVATYEKIVSSVPASKTPVAESPVSENVTNYVPSGYDPSGTSGRNS